MDEINFSDFDFAISLLALHPECPDISRDVSKGAIKSLLNRSTDNIARASR